jgi:hypothetical protein
VPVLRPTQESFVVVDLEGADRSDGIVRWAKKILLDGAANLARSRTYGWATLGERISGASAGISAPPEERSEAVAAFLDAAVGTAGQVALDPGKGLDWSELAPVRAADWRSDLRSGDDGEEVQRSLLAAGVVAAATAASGDLAGRRVVLEGPEPVAGVLGTAFAEVGATVVNAEDTTAPAALGAAGDILCCGSAVGMIDHRAISGLDVGWIVPWGPMPVTTRGLAVGRRSGTQVLPDFVTTIGPLLAAVAGTDDTVGTVSQRTSDLVAAVIAEVLDHEDGPLVGACVRAEAFLTTWQETLPFGRPIA